MRLTILLHRAELFRIELMILYERVMSVFCPARQFHCNALQSGDQQSRCGKALMLTRHLPKLAGVVSRPLGGACFTLLPKRRTNCT